MDKVDKRRADLREPSQSSKAIMAAMEGQAPMTCADIANPLGFSQRQVRSALETIISRGGAYMLEGTYPARYSLKPVVDYEEPEHEGLPLKRIHRPVGTWEIIADWPKSPATIFKVAA